MSSLSERARPFASSKLPVYLNSLDQLRKKAEITIDEQAQLNPIHLDVAVNELTLDLVNEKLRSENLYATDTLCKYYEEDGTTPLKKAAAEFFTKYFHSFAPILPNDLTFVTSVRGCMDLLGHCIADPGDVFLAYTPIYSKVPEDFASRSGVEIWPAPLTSKDNFRLSFEIMKSAYDSAIQAGKNVKGIFLINPGNPIGDVMSVQLMTKILQFAAQHELHVIADEIYALFVFERDVEFRSVLSLPDIPDPERTHVIYGLSKDFGLTAWRVGFIHSWNRTLNFVMQDLASNQCIPLPIMEATRRILSDHGWVNSIALDIPKTARMQFLYACDRLRLMGFIVRDVPASFFVWFYMGSVMKEVTFEEEEALAITLQKKCNLFVSPGKAYFSTEPGWFRIIFTVNSDTLVEGLDRLEDYVKSLK